MKRLILISLCFFILNNNYIYSQCTGGTSAGSITANSSWQIVNAVAGGTYYSFAAVPGSTYLFSFCTADGGSSIYDSQITLLNPSGNFFQSGYDDYCGVNARLEFYCTIAGTYRVLLTKYDCNPQNNMGKLAYKSMVTPACPTGLGSGVTNVASLPYSSGAGSTAGAVNDLTASNINVCGNSGYLYGEDKIWVFTPVIGGNITITLSTTNTKAGIYLYKGCPLNGNTSSCIESDLGGGNHQMNVCVEQGSTYYLVADSKSTTTNFTYSNLTISSPSAASSCSMGTVVNVSSLPYSSSGRTTCGKGNEVKGNNAEACGNKSYLANEDEVFSFNPVTSGNITVSITTSSSYSGIFLYEGCPMAGYCAGTGNHCLGSSTSASGSKSLCGYVTAGKTYYVVVDNYNGCFPYSISISSPSSNLTGSTCSNPVIVSSLPFNAIKENTTCMGDDYNNFTPGSCGSLYESGEDKVYRYNSPGSECIGISLSAVSSNSIGYQVYNGIPGNPGVSCIGNGGGAYSGALTGSVTLSTAGIYYIMIDTWSDPVSVIYNISLTSYGSAVANDLPCNAVPITLGTSVTGDNSCSNGTGEPSVPSCWNLPNNVNSVWYSFIAPVSGKAIIRTSPGSLRNTQIALYSGICGTGMTYISCNDNAGSCGLTSTNMSQLSATGLIAGNKYYIAVDGYATFTGSFGITVIDGSLTLPPVPGQDCSIALSACKSVITVGDPGFQSFGNVCDYSGGGTNCITAGERGTVWYEIQIASSGYLEFEIIPNDWEGSPGLASTDYDFVMWKTAGASSTTCSGIASGATPVRCNYSYLGVTGLYGTINGTENPLYPGFGAANQSRLSVLANEVYLIAISNFSNSVSGFRFEFSSTSPVNYTPTPSTVVWTGGTDNDWFKTENWGGCAIPACATNAIILSAAGNQPIINATGSAAKSLTIFPGSNLTINSGYNLSLCQDLYNYGSLNANGISTITLAGSLNQNVGGSFLTSNSFSNLTIQKNAGSATLLNDIEVSGNLYISDASGILNGGGHTINLSGNLNNNSGTFIPGTNGILSFKGSDPQTYLNNGILNTVNMNHSGSGVTLLSNMNIGTSGSLNLTTGKIITTENFEVNVLNSASSAVAAGNILSYVEGSLRRAIPAIQAARIFEFPVGHAAKGYQRATLNLFNGASAGIGSLKMSFNPYPAAVPSALGQDPYCSGNYNADGLDNGYWSLKPFAAGIADIHLTLYNNNYSNAGDIFTVMERVNGGSWIIPALVSGSCNSSSVNAVMRNGIQQIHTPLTTYDFGVAQGTIVLPVSLLSFIAEAESKSIITTWMTASEKNNKGFEVQRAIKADQFKTVGWVNASGNGNSTKLSTYNFDDKEVNTNQLYYYRLRQIDYNGKETFSKTVAAIIREKGVVIINAYPNPYKEATTIKYILSRPTIVTVEISDMNGKTVKKYQQGLQSEGSYSIPFSAREMGMTAGSYNVTVWCDDERNVIRLTESE